MNSQAGLAAEERKEMERAVFNKRGRIDNARAVRLLVAGTFLRLRSGEPMVFALMGSDVQRATASAGLEQKQDVERLPRDAYFVSLKSCEVFETASCERSEGRLKAIYLVSPGAGSGTQALTEQQFIDALLCKADPLYFNPYLEGVCVDRLRGVVSPLDRARIQCLRELVAAGLNVFRWDACGGEAFLTCMTRT